MTRVVQGHEDINTYDSMEERRQMTRKNGTGQERQDLTAKRR